MEKVDRLTASLAATVMVASAASPTPSPSLQSLLVAPAGAYAESQPGPTDGPMSASDYAGTDSLILGELERDGYVQGYVRSWGDQSKSSTHVIVEEVIAFGGHRDAAK